MLLAISGIPWGEQVLLLYGLVDPCGRLRAGATQRPHFGESRVCTRAAAACRRRLLRVRRGLLEGLACSPGVSNTRRRTRACSGRRCAPPLNRQVVWRTAENRHDECAW